MISLCAIGLLGCVASEVPVCADGTICPAPLSCHPSGECAAGPVPSDASTDAGAAKSWQAETLIRGLSDIERLDVQISGIVADEAGHIYLADLSRHRIVRLAPDGSVKHIAGTGVAGFSGDDGPAVKAQLSSPHYLELGGDEKLYVGDYGNHRVRAIDLEAGTITTVAGDGGLELGDDGPATDAALGIPTGLAFDAAGNLYIGNSSLHRVRKVDATTGVITTVVGTGSPGPNVGSGPATQLTHPQDIEFDAMGRLLIVDYGNHRVLRWDPVADVVARVAGTGTAGFAGDGMAATLARLDLPVSLTVAPTGDVFVHDSENHRIRRVSAVTGEIDTVAGTGREGVDGDDGPAALASLGRLAVLEMSPAGDLLVGDRGNRRVRGIDLTTGIITTRAGITDNDGTGRGEPATSINLNFLHGIAFDAEDNLFVPHNPGPAVYRVDAATGAIHRVAGTGAPGFSGDDGPATMAQLHGPLWVAVDSAGHLYISDSSNGRIRRVDASTGLITTYAGGDATLQFPTGLAFDADDNLFIADGGANDIKRVDAGTGMVTTYVGSSTQWQLDNPRGLAFDSQGVLYISELGAHRVSKVAGATGSISTYAGTGVAGFSADNTAADAALFNGPQGIAFDAQDNLYIADADNYRVRRVGRTTMKVNTVVGKGLAGFLGDGGPATDVAMSRPVALALDARGRLHVATHDDGRVRAFDPSDGTLVTRVGAVWPRGGGAASSAHLAAPEAVAVVPGGVLAAGTVLQMLRHASMLVETVAGAYGHAVATANLARFRSESFGRMGGVAVTDAGDRIYVTETGAHRVHVITVDDLSDPDGWRIAELAGGDSGHGDGPVGAARFRSPTGLSLDETAGTLYVVDTGNHAIRAIDLAEKQVWTVAGTPGVPGSGSEGATATAAALDAPRAAALCSTGDLFIADTNNNRVVRMAGGVVHTVLGTGAMASSGEGTPSNEFPVASPMGVACDPRGNVFVTSVDNVRMLVAGPDGVVDGTGEVKTIYGPDPTSDCLTGVDAEPGGALVVADACTGAMLRLRSR